MDDPLAEENESLAEISAALESWARESTVARRHISERIEIARAHVARLLLQAPETPADSASTAEEDLQHLGETVATLRRQLHHMRAAFLDPPDPQQQHRAEPLPPMEEDRSPLAGPKTSRHKKLGEILVESGIVSEEQLDDLLALQSETPYARLGTLLVEKGYGDEHLLARLLATQLDLPFTDLPDEEPDATVLTEVSGHLAKLHQCLPLRLEENRLVLAMANPLNLIAIEDIELAGKRKVDPIVAPATRVQALIDTLYPSS